MLKPLLWMSTLFFLGPVYQQTSSPAPTPIPAEAASMVSPSKPTPDSMEHAKKMYGYDCAVCHGANGKGKTDLATQMNLKLKDWTDPDALKGRTDGELFYIISNGMGQMPSEKERAKPEVIWAMVTMVRGYAGKT
jgi:mono/diheme cytochrome c family protein